MNVCTHPNHSRPFTTAIGLLLLLTLPGSLRAELLYTSDGTAITITGSNPQATGDLVIPATIDGLPVTSIGVYAFVNHAALTSVTIPATVSSIGEYAFFNCPELTNITLSADNLSYSSVDGVLFNKPRTILVAAPNGIKGTYTIPDTVTTIGERSLTGCTKLQSIVIPNSVTSIGFGAFHYCTSLISITVPDSVITIGEVAFMDCSQLTIATLGSGLSSVEPNAFLRCPKLTNIIVSTNNLAYSSNGGVLFNKSQTFLVAAPNGLAGTYTIPDTVTSITHQAFVGCAGLTNLTTSSNNLAYSSIDGVLFNKTQTIVVTAPNGMTGTYTIPNGVTTIGDSAFYGCRGFTNLTIPMGVTSIGEYSFAGCVGLPAITIPGTVTTIGLGAFYACAYLTNVTIPNSVTTIGNHAFQSCSRLTTATLGKNVTYIGQRAFAYSPALTSVYCYGNSPDHGPLVFEGDNQTTVYYILGKTGWGPTYADRPTAIFISPPTLKFWSHKNTKACPNIFATLAGGGDKFFKAEQTEDLKTWTPLQSQLPGDEVPLIAIVFDCPCGGHYTPADLPLSQLDPQAANRPFRFYRVVLP